MLKKFRIAAVALSSVALIAAGTVAFASGASWSYTGATGPSHWATIDPTNYAVCADGTAQSPININKPKPTPLANLKFDYVAGEAGIFNNGHTVEAEPLGTEKSTVTIGSTVYPFAQFHFHAPSEHEMNGLHYPVEVHFVHKTAEGKIAVVGVFIKAGATANADWAPFIAKLNTATADPEATKIELDWANLLPANKQTVRYDGSLTTPGCAEGVKWNVFTHPVVLSQAQINAFLEAYSGNNRPVQPLHSRKVLLDSTATK
ncbi:carbonic anhydrase [Rhodoluna sp.]|uniref:carbonic anhydrase n=1 Tax=Rhodoluna sp. TaxID=1969481 RepID=UPI0025D1D9C4|nr:carbonic anhydrase family protein [Rhodoluna sp.]